MKKFLPLLLMLIVVSAGCQTTRTEPTPMPVYEPPAIQDDQPVQRNPGSLFNERQANFLFDDNRARRVGDIVLVQVVEDTKATNKADTETDRSSSMNLGVQNLFGMSQVPVLGGTIGDTPLVQSSGTTNFAGEGETTRESTVTATIAARVVRVLPNGLLEVEGGRQTRVNEETQIIVLRGLIRSDDVSGSNTIKSTQMADAQIEYYGKGIIADKQRPGWISRILENIWPF